VVPKGYVPFKHENIARGHGYDGAPDPCEKYTVIGPIDEEARKKALPDKVPENIWPENMPQLRHVLEEYFNAVEKLSEQLLELMAFGLGVPFDFFKSKFSIKNHTLRGINYPAIEAHEGQTRMSEHFDTSMLTILLQDSGGLQVQNTAGEWIPVTPVPGAMVVNIGGLVSRWTNDKWLATKHRVMTPVPPPPETTCPRRISVAFFSYPNMRTTIEVLEPCRGDEIKYPPTEFYSILTKMMTARKQHGQKYTPS